MSHNRSFGYLGYMYSQKNLETQEIQKKGKNSPHFFGMLLKHAEGLMDDLEDAGKVADASVKLNRFLEDINIYLMEFPSIGEADELAEPMNTAGLIGYTRGRLTSPHSKLLSDFFSRLAEKLEEISVKLKEYNRRLKNDKKLRKHFKKTTRRQLSRIIRLLSADFRKASQHIQALKEAEETSNLERGWDELKEEYKKSGRYPKLCRAISLLKQDEFKPQAKGLELMARCNLAASSRYNEVYREGEKGFASKPLLDPHESALDFVTLAKIGPGSRVLDIGCGMGSESFAFALTGAEVFSLDNSMVAISRFRERLNESLDLSPNLTGKAQGNLCLLHENFSQIVSPDEAIRRRQIEFYKQLKLTHIYSNSSLHYYTKEVLEKCLEGIYEILREQNGYFGLAMKTIHSESASRKRHIRLKGREGLFLSFDLNDRVIRVYPANEEQIVGITKGAGLKVVKSYTKQIPDYDRESEIEEFCYILARAA